MFKYGLFLLFCYSQPQDNVYEESTIVDLNQFDIENYIRCPSHLPYINNYENLPPVSNLFHDDVHARTIAAFDGNDS